MGGGNATIIITWRGLTSPSFSPAGPAFLTKKNIFIPRRFPVG